MAKIPSTKIRDSRGDAILDIITGALLILVIIIVGYPCVYVVSCSISNPAALAAGRVVLWPVEPCVDAYEFVLNYKQVWIGFRNSVFYTACEVLVQMTMVILTAYPLSRRYYQGRSFIAFIFYMSTRFSAGIIPLFILKTNLGLYDNVWAIIFSGSVGVSHILILRTAFQTGIPGDLFDAAMIDGANQFQSLVKIALPLAKATLSVLILYVIVGQWNEYFNSMIYLQNPNLYSLQLVLRPIMTAASAASSQFGDMGSASQHASNSGLDHVRYALIVISSVPPVTAYFIVQKYFKGGVMMGSVKG